MIKRKKNITWVIICSYLLALLLSAIPLPQWLDLVRPQWLAMIVIYWAIVVPDRVSVGSAWLLGIIYDGLQGTIIGEYALALVLITYISSKMHRQIRVYPLWQQMAFVFSMMVIYQLLILWIQGVIGETPHLWMFWLSTLTTALCWPLVVILLDRYHEQNRMFV